VVALLAAGAEGQQTSAREGGVVNQEFKGLRPERGIVCVHYAVAGDVTSRPLWTSTDLAYDAGYLLAVQCVEGLEGELDLTVSTDDPGEETELRTVLDTWVMVRDGDLLIEVPGCVEMEIPETEGTRLRVVVRSDATSESRRVDVHIVQS
jgi:hypothetical protein